MVRRVRGRCNARNPAAVLLLASARVSRGGIVGSRCRSCRPRSRHPLVAGSHASTSHRSSGACDICALLPTISGCGPGVGAGIVRTGNRLEGPMETFVGCACGCRDSVSRIRARQLVALSFCLRRSVAGSGVFEIQYRSPSRTRKQQRKSLRAQVCSYERCSVFLALRFSVG
ncbi:unannotated protein [freshwater metagenome]|uniref:Unannotated protein n=1 Tax=freshwater metagenome TaxID=449393 RepID=A0A6J7N658_9ZZZZ